VIVDGDVQMLPAGAAAAIDTVLEDPLADDMKPAQLLVSTCSSSPGRSRS
jgi:hypothetical protein